MKKVIVYFMILALGVALVVFLLSKTTFGKVKEEYDKNKETIDQVTVLAHQLSIKTWIEAAEQKWVLAGDSERTITDPSYVAIKGEVPKKVEVELNEQGQIIHGLFSFEEGSYEYKDVKIKKNE